MLYVANSIHRAIDEIRTLVEQYSEGYEGYAEKEKEINAVNTMDQQMAYKT